MKVAIYMPKPQLCGPGTWCPNLRDGFRKLGHECDIVTFTKSGKPRAAFGRIQQFKGSDANCSLKPDVVGKEDDAWLMLNDYDLIVLDQVKTAKDDKDAIKHGTDPRYIEILSLTDTKFCSALHGKYYWEEHEIPKGRRAIQGTPFIRDLLTLPNFTGFLMDHARDFDSNCEAIRTLAPASKRAKMALPYQLQCTEGQALSNKRKYTVGCNGRMTGAKNRMLIQHALVELNIAMSVMYRGASSITTSACESFLAYQELRKMGFRGWRDETDDDTGMGPVQRPLPWAIKNGEQSFSFDGTFEGVWNGFGDYEIHLSVTDCGFSGGLLEFSTLEAMDAGCICIVTTPFLPDYPLMTGPFGDVSDKSVGAPSGVIELSVSVEFGESKKFWEEHGEEFKAKLREALRSAGQVTSLAHCRANAVMNNRAWIAEHCDPAKHAQAIIDGVASCLPQ